MSIFKINIPFSKIVITLLVINIITQSILSMDLSDEIKKTLLEDHNVMKNYKGKYKDMSCSLVVTSKLKALYETEDLDEFYYKIVPSQREDFLESLKNKMHLQCMERYKDDKFIFDSELFYFYPEDDSDYRHYVHVDIGEFVVEYNKFNNNGTNYDSPFFTKKRNSNNKNKKAYQKKVRKFKEINQENKAEEDVETAQLISERMASMGGDL